MKFYAKQRRKPSIVIVSLIDILAILLIFFIVTTTFRTEQPEIHINLPESATAEERPGKTEPVRLSITAEEELYLDQDPITVEELTAAVRRILEESPERPLALQADHQVSFGLLVRVLDALKEAGVRNLPAFTQPAS